MQLELAWAQNRGFPNSQQDALWNGRSVFQESKLLSTSSELNVSEFAVAVADGVATSPYPHMASRIALEALVAELNAPHQYPQHLPTLDAALIRRVHGRLCDRLAKGRSFGSSTTLVAAQIRGTRWSVMSVGDSRAYHIDNNGRCTRQTRDHTVLEGMIARGEAKPDVQYASIYDGLEYCLVADDEEIEFPIHHAEGGLNVGEGLLLCSDGLHDTVGEKTLFKLIDSSLSALQQVEVLQTAVLKRGAPDNVSILLVKSS